MQTTDTNRIPDDRRYSREHVWVRPDGDALVCGITDYAQDQLGEVVYVGRPEPGARFSAGESCGTVESMKSVSELFMPVSGELTACNDRLEDQPELLNQAPYGDGWIFRLRPDNPADFEAPDLLLAPAGYRDFLDTLDRGK